MKRGVGRGAPFEAAANGNGKAVFPPGTIGSVTRYRQPPPPPRTGLGLFGRILLVTFLVVTSLGLAVAGGAYLYADQTVQDLRARTPDVVAAQKSLHIAKANEPAIALVIGYDHRAGTESSNPSLSDTLMLIRADPVTKTISLLSFPRDLDVPIYCTEHGAAVTTDRINSAYSRCKSKGTLFTVERLTGLPVNYLMTVNFHGFKQVVDKLGGVWMDIDRRYYNPAGTGYATINLQPGYQKLSGGAALDFVRFRHTDSDLYRVARQQAFVRSFREQIKTNFSPLKVPSLVHTLAGNIEIAEGGHAVSLNQLVSYALFAYGLPTGHLFQDRIENVVCGLGCQASTDDIQKAVQDFSNPDVQSSKAANASALGQKIKQKAPPASSVTVTVLNGSGIAGVAANTSYALSQRGYQMLLPPNNLQPNTQKQSYFHTKIYYDPAQKRSKAAALALENVLEPAEVAKMPRSPGLLALDPGAMLLVVLGTAFPGTLPPQVQHAIPKHQAAYVRFDRSQADPLLQPLVKKVNFRLMVPTILERTSYADRLSGDKPVRYYYIKDRHKAVRLVFKTAGNEFWGVEETDWEDAPALTDRSFRHSLGGREFDLYYSASKLHMVVLRQGSANYWVVNTLRDSLSNETMIAIAKGLKPLTTGK